MNYGIGPPTSRNDDQATPLRDSLKGKMMRISTRFPYVAPMRHHFHHDPDMFEKVVKSVRLL